MILHVDMDAFYASVEILDNPDYAGKPVIVGGLSGRGVVAAASYEARKFGIHSAMPMFQALKKCPDAIVVPPRKKRYKEVSQKIMAILEDFSPLVEQVSIDEAYLDTTGCHRLFGSAEEIACEIKNRINANTQLTCSIGVASVKFLAKIASDMDKPDGLTVIPPEKVSEFVYGLPVEKTPGVGPKLSGELCKSGIVTLGDIQSIPERMLVKKFGKFGHRLKELSMGKDTSQVTPFSSPKSISAEETLPIDTKDQRLLKKYLLHHAGEVGSQLRKSGFNARTVFIKLKFSDFRQITRSATLQTPTCLSGKLYSEACRLFQGCIKPAEKIRLIGLGASGLVRACTPTQLTLFDTSDWKEDRWERIERIIDAVQERFGKKLLNRAILNKF